MAGIMGLLPPFSLFPLFLLLLRPLLNMRCPLLRSLSLSLSLSLASVSEKAVGRPYSSLLLFAFLCSFFFSRLRRGRFLLLFLPPLSFPPSGAPEISKSQIISSKSASGFLMIVG